MAWKQVNQQTSRNNNKSRLFIAFVLMTAIFLIFAPMLASDVNASSKIPKVRHSVKPLDLSRPPTTNEIMASGQLGGQLYPTDELTDKQREKKINLSFGEAIQEWNKHEYKKAVKMFRKHIEEYPDSPWASEAVLHVGCDATYNGRYTEAEESFKWILEKNKDRDHEGAKLLMNKAKTRLGILKVYQNNFKEAKQLFGELKKESPDWRDRTYASHWIQRLSRYSTNQLAMLNCGTQALAYLLEKDGKKVDARKVIELLPESVQGHSIKDLSNIASRYGYNLTAVRILSSEINKLPLPAIMHISPHFEKGGQGGFLDGDKGHYWILERIKGDKLALYDPQSRGRFEQRLHEFSREWSGNAVVFSGNQNLPGIKLAESEIERIFGGCCGARRPEEKLGCSGRNLVGSGCGCNIDKSVNDQRILGKKPLPFITLPFFGAPSWSVNVVNMNLFVTDVPLWYSSPIGPSVEIQLSYNSQSAINNNEPFGNKWQFNYASYLVVDTADNVIVFMPDGRRDMFTPDGTGGYSTPYQVFNTLTKIAENYFQLKFPDDTVYVYNIPPGTTSLQPFLVEIRDAHGQKLRFGYDSNVQLTTITDAMGRVTNLTYNAEGLVTQVNDPFGRSATFEYDSNRNLAKITDMGGYWSSLTYDSDVYLTGIEDSRGKWSFYIEPSDSDYAGSDDYSPPGGPMWESYRITVTNPLKGKEEYFYYGGCDSYTCSGYTWYVSPRDYIPWQSQEINNFRINTPKTRYFFTMTGSGQRGEISKILYPEGGYVEYGYDSATGNRTSIKDSHGHITNYTYNYMGRVTSIKDAKGITTTMNYDSGGVDLLEIINGLGTVTMTYNSMHDVTSITDLLGYKTTFTYNNFGQIESRTDAKDVLDILTTYSYYANHHLQQVVRDSKTIDSFTYDPIGRVKTHADATGLILTYDYNNLNNITKITYTDSKFESYAYSTCCPRLIDSSTDRSGRTTSNKYDALKRLIETVNPEGGLTRYEYDANGNMIRLIDPNSNATAFEYNKDNRLIKKTFADGKYTTISYDTAGLPSSTAIARGITTNYTYDANHNLLTINYADMTPDVSFQYDDYNRVTLRTDGVGAYQFTYDANSQLKTVDGPWVDDTITYQYDALGRKTSLTPQNGQAVSYTYDNLSRLTGIQEGSNIYSYSYINTNPLIQSLTRPNTSFTTYQYDSLNRLTEISNKNSASAIINQFVYGYDPNKDVRSSETITNGNPITSFQNELITYNYNKVNQLLSSTNPDKAFTYDDDGNMTQGYTPEGYVFTATYDAENRLTSIEYTDSGGVVHRTEYLYNGDDFLAEMKKYENGALVNDSRFVRDGFLSLQERDGSNNVVREYLWGQNMGGGIGGLLNLTQSGQDYSYLYDGKGNVTAVIGSAQAVAATYTYDTFGNLMTKTGTLNQPYQFSTKLYDEKTGLSYYGYRFYSPAIGRWITRDPLGEAGGMNLYGFVGGNPVEWVDRWGLQYLPDPDKKPPDWKPDWPTGEDSRGPYSQNPDSGEKWYPHPEDERHHDHYDSDKGKRYPKDSVKPRPGQKKPKPGQSWKDPWKNANYFCALATMAAAIEFYLKFIAPFTPVPDPY